VLDLELKREGKSYTSDTLLSLREQFPDDELIFLVGTDMFLSLLTWHEPETILACAGIAVFAREDDRAEEIAAMARKLRTEYGAGVYVIPGEPYEVSSTEIRTLLPQREGRELLPALVYSYIIQKRLYGAKPELAWLRSRADSYLKPKRIPHVRGVEETAVKLASLWGADPGDAAEAAICHDITKYVDHDEQLRLCEKYAIMTDELERGSEKLLHARTGAAFARELFGLSDAVTGAIRWHTTGRPEMTTLEKITYLADYIEPNRYGFAGLEELRTTCFEDLDQAMELATRMSIDEVAGKGLPCHENTVACHAYYRQRLRDRGLAPVHADGIPEEV
jgi:nicotinate-nucleotide adenylyltransferase